MLIAVNVGFLLQFVEAFSAKYPDIFNGITLGSTSRESSVYVATFVDWLAADFTTFLCHLQPEIALRTAVAVAFSILVDYFKWLTAYPYIVTEKFNFLHFFLLSSAIRASA